MRLHTTNKQTQKRLRRLRTKGCMQRARDKEEETGLAEGAAEAGGCLAPRRREARVDAFCATARLSAEAVEADAGAEAEAVVDGAEAAAEEMEVAVEESECEALWFAVSAGEGRGRGPAL
jgi:hypothetical protein